MFDKINSENINIKCAINSVEYRDDSDEACNDVLIPITGRLYKYKTEVKYSREMTILKWMSRVTIEHIIRNKYIRGSIGVTSIEDQKESKELGTETSLRGKDTKAVRFG